jgi:uncharacterized protein (DUF1501 family)
MSEERLSCDGYRRAVSRRGVMAGVGLGLLSWWNPQAALAQIAVNPGRNTKRAMVVIFLRGGADGLSLVAPYGDDGYYRARPNLAIGKGELGDLNGFFGLHPMLMPWMDLYELRKMTVVHACSSRDSTRSHFEAMDTMERGVGDGEGPASGWLARYLRGSKSEADSPLRAISFSSTMPASLVGATNAIALTSAQQFRLEIEKDDRASTYAQLAKLYAGGQDEVAHAGRETLHVLKALDALDVAGYRPSNGATYPDTGLGAGLRETACLLRAGIGLEIAVLDKGGWDTHVAQGTATVGWLPTLLDDVGKSVAAFAKDLGSEFDDVTVVVQSEFGRRIAENAGLGTDHGHGNCLFLLGGGLKGGVHAEWPGLDHRVGPGDLNVTTDYRDVLAETLQSRLGAQDVRDVFPDHRPQPVGLFV